MSSILSIFIILTNNLCLSSQKFEVLYQLETLCKCNYYKYPDSIIQNEILSNSEFFLGNSRNTILTLNFYVFKSNKEKIKMCLEKLSEFGFEIDKSILSRCNHFINFDTINYSQKKYDSTDIIKITKMFDTEQNIRTLYKPIFGFNSIKNVMITIDSLNMRFIDSIYIKTNIFPSESNISSIIFYKLFLILFHNVNNLNEYKWNEIHNYLYSLLEKGILNNNFYSMLVDRYLEKNGLQVNYGEGISKINNNRIGEINSNRVKIGLKELYVGCD